MSVFYVKTAKIRWWLGATPPDPGFAPRPPVVFLFYQNLDTPLPYFLNQFKQQYRMCH